MFNVKCRLTDHLVFSLLFSLPTANITPLKQPYCISVIISSMPSDNRSCHVFASSISLPPSILLTRISL